MSAVDTDTTAPLTGTQIIARITGAGGLTFTDATFAITGSSDATKIAKFEVDGFTTATTRTFTLPDATGTLAILGLAQTWSAAQTVSTAASNGLIMQRTDAYGLSGGPSISMRTDDGTAIGSGNSMGGLFFQARRDASNMSAAARVGARATQLWTNTAAGTKLEFETTPNGSTTRGVTFTLDQDGSALISGGSNNGLLTIQTITAGNARALRFVDTGGTKYNWQVGAQTISDNAFEIAPSTAAGGSTYSTPAVVIHGATGNVALGSTSDDGSNKLQVTGGSKFTGIVTGSTQLNLGGGTPNSSYVINIASNGGLTQTGWVGLSVQPVTVPTQATTSVVGEAFLLTLPSSAGAYASVTARNVGAHATASGSSITRANGDWLVPQTAGSNNCDILISTVNTYTGSWAIKSDTTKASKLAGNLYIGQHFSPSVVSIVSAASTSVLDTTTATVVVVTGTTTHTLTLPAANALGAGQAIFYLIKNASTGAVTVNRAGSDTINDASSVTTKVVASFGVLRLVSDGVSAWEVV